MEGEGRGDEVGNGEDSVGEEGEEKVWNATYILDQAVMCRLWSTR